MVNPNAIDLRFARLRAVRGLTNQALSALIAILANLYVEVHTMRPAPLAHGRFAPITTGLGGYRVVSISRGSPPPKKR